MDAHFTNESLLWKGQEMEFGKGIVLLADSPPWKVGQMSRGPSSRVGALMGHLCGALSC